MNPRSRYDEIADDLAARDPNIELSQMMGMPCIKSGGKMVIGYAAFAKHLGLYPHSGSVIPLIDCTPFKTSKSGVLFTPDRPLPDARLEAILHTRQAELTAGYGLR